MTEKPQLYTLQAFEGSAFTKPEQQERKRHFFEWLEQPDNYKTPKTIGDAQRILGVSHPTICKWHKEWKNAVSQGLRTRVKVSPEEVTTLLTKRLSIIKPMLESNKLDATDPVDYMKQTVELGLWYAAGQITNKIDTMMGLVLLPDQAVELLGSLVSTLDKMEQMALRRVGRVKAEYKEEKVIKEFGALVAGMHLPSSGAPGEPVIEIPGRVLPALSTSSATDEKDPIIGEDVSQPELIEDEPPVEQDEEEDAPPSGSDFGLEA